MASFRDRLLLAGGAIVALAFVVLPASGASAETFYDDGTCVVNQLTDGAPAGGSQCAGVDLTGHSLGQAAFMGANLAGADLSGDKLQAANFTGANITGTNFTDSQVDGADFTDTGILPATITATATSADGAAIAFAPVVPTGMTPGPCTIVDQPIVSGQVFPIGESGFVCKFATSNGSANVVVKVSVTAAPTATPPAGPVFTSAPPLAAGTTTTRGETNWGLFGIIAGAAVLVLGAGIAAMIVSRRRPVVAATPAAAAPGKPDDDTPSWPPFTD